MAVRRTIEIGRDGAPDLAATTLGNEPRSAGEDQRSAIGRAEDDARMTSLAVGDYDCQRAGELTRFSAQLQIAPAGIRRQLGNMHAFDDLVGGELGLEDPGR